MSNDNTEPNARAVYEDSKAKLQAIISDLGTDQSVADAAEQKLRTLGLEFAAAWDTIEARTANLTAIADKLKVVIAAAGQNPAADALDQVTGVTSGLAEIVKQVNGLTDRMSRPMRPRRDQAGRSGKCISRNKSFIMNSS